MCGVNVRVHLIVYRIALYVGDFAVKLYLAVFNLASFYMYTCITEHTLIATIKLHQMKVLYSTYKYILYIIMYSTSIYWYRDKMVYICYSGIKSIKFIWHTWFSWPVRWSYSPLPYLVYLNGGNDSALPLLVELDLLLLALLSDWRTTICL